MIVGEGRHRWPKVIPQRVGCDKGENGKGVGVLFGGVGLETA